MENTWFNRLHRFFFLSQQTLEVILARLRSAHYSFVSRLFTHLLLVFVVRFSCAYPDHPPDDIRHSTGGSSNLMGKFTQSVRRIVQDVKDEGTMSGLSREEVIEINERLILFRFRLEMSYDTAKQALNALMSRYGDSKSQRNIFHRYPLLKIMIKVNSLTNQSLQDS